MDCWLNDHPLRQLQGQEDHAPEVEALVCDFWSEGRGWDWQRIGDSLSHTNLMKLASTSLRSDREEGDQLGWLKSNGVFSVRAAYEFFTDLKKEEIWPGWKRIWKLKIQQRIKTFLWLLAHDLILTNHCRWRRKLVDNPLALDAVAIRKMQYTLLETARCQMKYGLTVHRQVLSNISSYCP